eukprot:5345004-Lingulodinium_polyedra.AAC.1
MARPCGGHWLPRQQRSGQSPGGHVARQLPATSARAPGGDHLVETPSSAPRPRRNCKPRRRTQPRRR